MIVVDQLCVCYPFLVPLNFKIKERKYPAEKKVKLMAKNCSESTSLKQRSEEESKCTSLKQLSEEPIIEIVVPDPECCIYRVPKRLREKKVKVYTPQLVSIGPFHHGNKELADMEKQKKRYYDVFVKRCNESDPEKLWNFVKEKEQCIRGCYAEASPLESLQFTEMILYDAIFIIELFLRNFDNWRYAGDFLLDQLWLKEAIKLDLQLLENQLPFFVLDGIYKKAFGRPTGEVSLLSLCCKFFGYDKPNDMFRRIPERIEFKHFVDLSRNCIVEFRPIGEEMSAGDLPSAVKLNESGVKFKRMDISDDKLDGAQGLLDIKFQPRKRSKCMQLFKGKVSDELRIPRIIIEDTTECVIRNMMALEQCHYPSKTHLCNYIELIDSLINTKEDVDLLVEKEIISNHVGHHEAISKMFNELCLEIRLSEKSCYQGIRKELKDYHDKWWNRTKATLISVYFKDIWRGTATVAATIVLLLQLIQTAQRLSGGWTPH